MSLVDAGKKDLARNLLEHFDKNVLESNFSYGMTSNRGNQHNRISMSFLLACYQAEDPTLAKKVAASVKKDLEQQMRYYKGLGESTSDEQLAINAQMARQGKGGNLSDKQAQFVDDILSSYQMLLNLTDWEKQFAAVSPAAASEKNPALISNPPPPAKGDTKPRKAN
jgi:hypothetical protein